MMRHDNFFNLNTGTCGVSPQAGVLQDLIGSHHTLNFQAYALLCTVPVVTTITDTRDEEYPFYFLIQVVNLSCNIEQQYRNLKKIMALPRTVKAR